MVFLLAFLMALGAVTYPVTVDIVRHGRENILMNTMREVGNWSMLAALRTTLDKFIRNLSQLFWRVVQAGAFVAIITTAAYAAAKYIIAHLF